MIDWIKLALEIGAKVLEIASSGRKSVRIDEVLPESYRDRERLKELEAKARAHFGNH